MEPLPSPGNKGLGVTSIVESEDMANSLSGFERETVITTSDGDDVVRIWSAQRAVITALRKKNQVTEISNGIIGNTEWASFTIPKDQWNPATGVKRRSTMTEEQKQRSVERLKRYREEQDAQTFE